MPKQKSHSGFKKRVKISKKGKVLFKMTGARHRLISKSKNNKRKKRVDQQVSTANNKMIHKLLPYA
jgi:large subunit ribosomal protein L35